MRKTPRDCKIGQHLSAIHWRKATETKAPGKRVNLRCNGSAKRVTEVGFLADQNTWILISGIPDWKRATWLTMRGQENRSSSLQGTGNCFNLINSCYKKPGCYEY